MMPSGPLVNQIPVTTRVKGTDASEHPLQQGPGNRGLRVAAQLKQQQQWNPEATGELCEVAAHVHINQHVAQKDRGAPGKSGGAVGHHLPCEGPVRQPGRRQHEKRHYGGDRAPRDDQAKQRAREPCQWRVEHKPWLTRSEIRPTGPVRINDAVEEAPLCLDPRDEVEREIRPTRWARPNERPDPQCRGCQNYDLPGEAHGGSRLVIPSCTRLGLSFHS